MSDEASRTITGTFPTREAADLVIEHLTQEHGIDRADIFVEAVGTANTAGTRPSGGDAPSRDVEDERQDGALRGEIQVSADVAEAKFHLARRIFTEAGARNVTAE